MSSTNRQNAERPVTAQYKTTPVQKEAGRQASTTLQEVTARHSRYVAETLAT